MEFSEIAELNRFVGISRSPKKRPEIRSNTQYLESISERPIDNLINPSPFYVSKALKRANQIFAAVPPETKDCIVISSDDQSAPSQGNLQLILAIDQNNSSEDNSLELDKESNSEKKKRKELAGDAGTIERVRFFYANPICR